MAIAPGAIAYKFAFQLSPIFLTGGVAGPIPGQVLPILALTEAINLPLGLAASAPNIELDEFFANWEPLSGSTLIDNAVAEYPFANQTVAANALIEQPLMVSMKMIVPAKGPAGYAAKTATMLLLVAALRQHNRSGGTYTVITPSNFYTNCIMLGMRDITSRGGRQVQVEWQFDFRQPLLTLQAAQSAQNSLMSKMSSGGQLNASDVSWSGTGTNVGQLSGLTPVGPGSQAVGSSVVAPEQLPPVAGVPSQAYNTVQPIPSGYPQSS